MYVKDYSRGQYMAPHSVAKGQSISTWFFGVIDFLQETNEQIRLYYYETSDRFVLVRFLEDIDNPKKHFEIN